MFKIIFFFPLLLLLSKLIPLAHLKLEPWLNEHKSLVYRFQSLVRFWQPLPQFIGILLLCNFLLLWIGSWLTSWSLLTGAALYGLGWLCLETFPISMPIYNSNVAIPDAVNPETQSGRDRGLKTTGELVDQVDRVVQFLVACIVLLKAFQRAHPRRFFAEMGAILVLCGVLGTKMATPRLLCLLSALCG